MSDPVELLVRLVETPSVSGNEHDVVALIAEEIHDMDLEPTVSGRNVWCSVPGSRGDGPTLLLQAHIDTVPPSPGWSADPHVVRRPEGRIQGLGANDVKGGAAAMLTALRQLTNTPFAGTLLFAATCDEETGGEGLEVLRPELPPIDGAVIAEPTNHQVATAQRGLMRVVIACEGQSAHAARPWQGVNAIELAMDDIAALRGIEADREHEVLGRSTMAVTVIEGGTRANVIPSLCRYTIDVRPTPLHDNAWWEERIRAETKGRVEVMRNRIVPVETATDDPLVQAALGATGNDAPIPFGGVSDLFHVRDVAGIVLGPGLPEQSHQADEWIEEAQVRRAVDVYRDLALRYLG